MPLKPRPLSERLREKIRKDPETGCWEWTAGKSSQGYGVVHSDGKQRLVHRVSWELERGEIPAGLQIDHLCRNRACCNPDHLEPVTGRENVLRSPTAPTAINARKTHCDAGHPLEGANLDSYALGRGVRACRECSRAN